MAKFPIVRAERLPPGVGPSVRGQIDFRTGGAELGRAIAGAGAALAELGLDFGARINRLEAQSQLSNSISAAADAEIAFFTKLQANNEPTTYNKELDTLFADFSKVAPTNRQALAVYNQRISNRRLALARRVQKAALDKATSNVQASHFMELQKAKETGDFSIYSASIAQGVKDGVYTAVQGEALLDAAVADKLNWQKTAILKNALAQRDIGIIDASDLPQDAKEEVKDRYNKRIRTERQEQEYQAQTIAKQLVFDLQKIQDADLSPKQRDLHLSGLIEQLSRLPLTTNEARSALDRIEAVRQGGDIKTDKLLFGQVMTRIRKLNSESLPEEVADARRLIFENQASISTADFASALNSLDTLLDKDKAKAIDTVVNLAIQRGQITKGFDDAAVTIQLEKWANDDPDRTAKEIFVYGKELTADYVKTPAPIFTPAHIQKTLGQLTAKSWVTDFGYPVIISTGAAAISHVLTSLGPNWQRLAPEAADIIKKNWPGTKIPKLDVIPAKPEGYPPDARWNAARRRWTWARNGRLLSGKAGSE